MLQRLCQLDAVKRADLARAVWYLARSRVAFGLRPSKAILDDLQAPQAALPNNGQHIRLDPRRVSWAIAAASRRLPWRSDCLFQAIAAAEWLRRQGHAPHFHLGVKRSEQGALTAHAWLTLDGRTIVGGGGSLDQFSTIMATPSNANIESPSSRRAVLQDHALLMIPNQTPSAPSSREFEVLLALCLGGPLQRADTPAPDAAPFDWEELLALANRHRVDGMLCQGFAAAPAQRIAILAQLGPVPPSIAARLEAARRKLTMTGLGQAGETLRLLKALETAGHAAIVLKGRAVGQLLFAPHPELRQSIDIDLLIEPASSPAIGRLLEADGFRRVMPEVLPQPADSMARLLLNAFSYLHPSTGHKVELHHRPLLDPHVFKTPFAELLARSTEVQIGNASLRSLGPADLMVYLCCHAAGHTFFRLKWLADIARLVDRMGPAGVAETLAHARTLGCERPVQLSLVLLDRLTGRQSAPPEISADPVLSGLTDDAVRAILREEADGMGFKLADLPQRLRAIAYGVRLAPTWRSATFWVLKHSVHPTDLETLKLGAAWAPLYAVVGRPLGLLRWIGRSIKRARRHPA